MKIKIPINYRIIIYGGKVHEKPLTENFPKEWYYDEPLHIYERIEETLKLKELIQKYENIIYKRIGKEKIRTFNKKRWNEYQEKHKYRMTPTENFPKEWCYNENSYNQQ